jgi:hypothetical protein
VESQGGIPKSPLSIGSSLGMAAAGAAASIFCIRTGFFSFFFLFPLGLTAFFGGVKAAWAGGILAVAGNIFISLWMQANRPVNPVLLQWSILYYSAMVLVFTWINAPPGNFLRLEIPYRMAVGAVLCTVLMGPVFLSISSMNDSILYRLMVDQLASLNSELSGIPDAEQLISSMVYTGLRGGILIFCMVFWWINRQIAAGIVRIVKHLPAGGNPIAFHVPFFFIWIFSLALGTVLLGKIMELELLEIGGWNILVLSGILYLIQGGIIGFQFLLKLPPLMRILINVGIILLLFIPGINMAVLGLLVVLGIAENWVPFRAPKE